MRHNCTKSQFITMVEAARDALAVVAVEAAEVDSA